eukprot:gene3794-13863_t
MDSARSMEDKDMDSARSMEDKDMDTALEAWRTRTWHRAWSMEDKDMDTALGAWEGQGTWDTDVGAFEDKGHGQR